MSTESNHDTKRTNAGRYRYVQYDDDGQTVSIIQDTENQQAWIQSTHTLAVER